MHRAYASITIFLMGTHDTYSIPAGDFYFFASCLSLQYVKGNNANGGEIYNIESKNNLL